MTQQREPVTETEGAIDPPYIEEQYQRLAALLLTMPGWTRNYTASVDAARWIVNEAKRVGWQLSVGPSR